MSQFRTLDRFNIAQTEAYTELLNVLDWTEGFGILFINCTPAQEPQIIEHIQQDLPHKPVEHLTLTEEIHTLSDRLETLHQTHNCQILFISGLAKSLEPYIRPGVGGEGDYYKLDTVPPILKHLNYKRELFKDSFPIILVFLLPTFGIKYFIQRALDFFDWRSGYVEFPADESASTAKGHLTQPDPSDSDNAADQFFMEGNRFYYADRYEEAIASYDRALEIEADNNAAWYRRAYSLVELGRYEEAIASYDRAVEIKPDYHDAWINRGFAFENLGRYEEEIESCDRAITIKPDAYQAWMNRGVALFNLGRYEEAIASYDRAVEIKPDDHEAWYGRGYALDDLGRYEEAIASYDRAVEIKPDKHEAWYNKACCYGLQNQLEPALIHLQQAITLDPKYREMAKTDTDFDSLRDRPQFQTLLNPEVSP